MAPAALYLVALTLLLPCLCDALSGGAHLPTGDGLPVRRARYKGLYPKQFKEKYKEMRGDEEVINRVVSKGSTPAGTHIAIMLNETLACLGLLDPRALELVAGEDRGGSIDEQLALYPPRITRPRAGVFIDCTLGYGGHSLAILRLLPQGSVLYGIDQDQQELPRATARILCSASGSSNDVGDNCTSSSSFVGILDNFSNLDNITTGLGLQGKVAGLMADLGFSSMQVDDPSRGFSRKFDGPLDMRMNAKNTSQETASQLVQRLGVKELQRLIEVNSDERYSRQIALSIKAGGDVTTTSHLVRCVEAALKAVQVTEKAEVDRTVARVMQALRIAVNDEFGALDSLLAALPSALCSGGRAVFLTFHSGEDRRVKKAFQHLHRQGTLSSWGRGVIRAGSRERRSNPRSKCCKLRWCVRA